MEDNFGELLRQLREKRNYSVNQLALKSGVSSAHISRLENEKRSVPKPTTIKKLANVLGCYNELMRAAGYKEEIIDHGGYEEYIFTNIDGELIDIIQKIKVMNDKDKDWVNTAYRVATELPERDKEIIDSLAKNLLEKHKSSK